MPIPIACVEDLSSDLAARHIEGFPHSIQQLVFHMNYWMDYELRRIRGEKPAYPEHNSESFPPTASRTDSQDWDRLRQRFADLLSDFVTLANSISTRNAAASRDRARSRQKDRGHAGSRALADGGAQQLPHRPNRNDPPYCRRVATTRRRGYVVKIRGELQTQNSATHLGYAESC